MNWTKTMKYLKLEHIKKSAPGFFELSGGYDMKIKPYTDKSANGLTKCIIDFITFNNGSATRINTQGQARVEKIQLASGKQMDKVRYTPSMTRRGTADLHACIRGKHISIEIKTGSDKMSEFQNKEKERIENAGGLFWEVKNMDDFIELYNKHF